MRSFTNALLLYLEIHMPLQLFACALSRYYSGFSVCFTQIIHELSLRFTQISHRIQRAHQLDIIQDSACALPRYHTGFCVHLPGCYTGFCVCFIWILHENSACVSLRYHAGFNVRFTQISHRIQCALYLYITRDSTCALPRYYMNLSRALPEYYMNSACVLPEYYTGFSVRFTLILHKFYMCVLRRYHI